MRPVGGKDSNACGGTHLYISKVIRVLCYYHSPFSMALELDAMPFLFASFCATWFYF